MENENNIEGVSNNNTKVVFLVVVVFIIIASVSVYSFFKIKNSKQLMGSVTETSVVLDNKQEELAKMNAELDAIREQRGVTQKSTITLKEQVKSMDELRKNALQQKNSSTTIKQQESELEKLKSNSVNN